MKRITVFSCVLLVLFSPSFALADNDEGGGFRLAGSGALLPCCEIVMRDFVKAGGERGECDGGGSRKGIQLLCEGKCDVAVVDDRLDDAARKLLAAAFPDADNQPREMLFATASVVIITHPSSPLKNLTREQLQAIAAYGYAVV